MAIKEKWQARNRQGKLISLRQFLSLPALETVSENVQIQDRAFERIQKTIDTQGVSMPRNSWSCRAMHINFGFKGEAAIKPWKTPWGSSQATAAHIAEISTRTWGWSACPEKSIILAGTQGGTASRGHPKASGAEISLVYMQHFDKTEGNFQTTPLPLFRGAACLSTQRSFLIKPEAFIGFRWWGLSCFQNDF